MIKIPLSDEQKIRIEKIYWDWISRYHLMDFFAVLKNDEAMERLILDEAESDLKKAVKQFLLMDCQELETVKLRIDQMRKEGIEIKDDTKDFLLARYQNYRKSQSAKVIQIMDISVCPYCNQNHINAVYEKGGRMKFYGDLDHFYDKSTYPELMICLYNMVPACKVCNQLKSCQKEKIINPYNCDVERHIRFKTDFDEKMDLDYLQGTSQNFRITIEPQGLSQEELEEIKLFDLEKRYQFLKRNAQEIIVKSKAYDQLYQEQLKRQFGIGTEELSEYIFGYTEDHLNRVLSKFNKDIMNEFRPDEQ